MIELGSLESTKEATVALGCTSRNSYASEVFSPNLLYASFNHYSAKAHMILPRPKSGSAKIRQYHTSLSTKMVL